MDKFQSSQHSKSKGSANDGAQKSVRSNVTAPMMGATSGATAVEAAVFTPASLLKISESHKNELRQAFDMFDTEGTGRIKAHEVKVALYALGYDVTNLELQHLLRAANTASTEVMDFNDFYNVLVLKMTDKESRIESVRAFRQIDEDDKSGISLDDLRRISDSLNMGLTDDELIEMILFAHPPSSALSGGEGGAAAEFDAKEALLVPEEEFLKLMKRANVY